MNEEEEENGGPWKLVSRLPFVVRSDVLETCNKKWLVGGSLGLSRPVTLDQPAAPTVLWNSHGKTVKSVKTVKKT